MCAERFIFCFSARFIPTLKFVLVPYLEIRVPTLYYTIPIVGMLKHYIFKFTKHAKYDRSKVF